MILFLSIYFYCFAMKEIPWCLFLMIHIFTQAGIAEAFNSTSRYIDDILDIDKICVESMSVKIIYLNCS